jgi:hypothetical protein
MIDSGQKEGISSGFGEENASTAGAIESAFPQAL